MSILIKGLSKREFEKILKYARYGADNCMIGVHAEVVDLPQYGRLIDADALIEALPSCTGDDEQISKHGAIRDFIILVEKAPTIVDAEGGE